MQRSPRLSFKSSAFPPIPGEDAQTNPGIYGKALAEWLRAQLRALGFTAGDVIAEDFGWCVPVESLPQPVYVACASGSAIDAWQVFCFAEPGLRARLLGRADGQAALQTVFDALHASLAAAVGIRELREEA